LRRLPNHGLAGPANSLYNNCCGAPNAFFTGGDSSVLSQLFRRNFPDYSAGRRAQHSVPQSPGASDYVTDQLQLRQSELQFSAPKPSAGGCEDRHDRHGTGAVAYQTAVDARTLAEKSLEAEQETLPIGRGTVRK